MNVQEIRWSESIESSLRSLNAELEIMFPGTFGHFVFFEQIPFSRRGYFVVLKIPSDANMLSRVQTIVERHNKFNSAVDPEWKPLDCKLRGEILEISW